MSGCGHMKIKDLKSNSNITIKVRVCTQEKEKLITKNRNFPLRVCEFKVGDETGIVKLSLFNQAIDNLASSVGEVIKIYNGWSKSWQGNMQVSMGRSGIWEVLKGANFPSVSEVLKNDKSQPVEQLQPKGDAPLIRVNNILPNMNISTRVRVCERKPTKYLNYKDGRKLKVRTFLVGDDTGVIPMIAFNEEIDQFGKIMGEVIDVRNFWAKFYSSNLQVSTGSHGKWDVVVQDDFPTADDLLSDYRKTQLELLNKLTPRMVYYSEIVGIKYQQFGKQIYQKEALTELELIPEPENPYDNKAVGVWLEGKKMGYIPRKQNKAIFLALQQGSIDMKCMLGIYAPHIDKGYNLPHRIRNMPITISTHVKEIEWRPVMIYPEDVMVLAV